MDVQYINAFVESIDSVFSTMLSVSVEIDRPHIKEDPNATHDVSAIIGMSGEMVGVVVLSFPTPSAEKIASKFAQTELKVGNPDLVDALGELVNMISGGAKAKFKNRQAYINIPTVIIGREHQVFKQRNTATIAIPCKSDMGEFVLEVSLKPRTS